MHLSHFFAYILCAYLCCCSFWSRADYNGHHIEFVLALEDGTKETGYAYLADVYDYDPSTSYTAFLEENYSLFLKEDFDQKVTTYRYFKHRIQYHYTDPVGTASTAYCLTEPSTVSKAAIKNIQINALIEFSYAKGISKHQWSDRKWMQKPAVDQYALEVKLCTYELYVHQASKKVKKLLQALKKLEKKCEEERNDLEENWEGSTDYNDMDWRMAVEQLQDEQAKQLRAILNQFEGLKVVVITTCSC